MVNSPNPPRIGLDSENNCLWLPPGDEFPEYRCSEEAPKTRLKSTSEGRQGTPAPLKPCVERPCANAYHRMSIHLVLIQYMLGVTESTSNKHTSQQMFVVTCQMTWIVYQQVSKSLWLATNQVRVYFSVAHDQWNPKAICEIKRTCNKRCTACWEEQSTYNKTNFKTGTKLTYNL